MMTRVEFSQNGKWMLSSWWDGMPHVFDTRPAEPFTPPRDLNHETSRREQIGHQPKFSYFHLK